MGPRRHHTKSRLGCSQCKSRRIKCDESRPTCSNCQRREITCDFSLSGGVSTTHPSAPSPVQSTDQNGVALSPSTTPPDPAQHGPAADLGVIDLELLHHFTIFTYQSLPLGAAKTSEIWSVHVVQLGFKHGFLLSSILAVAALHLSVLRPTYRELYVLKASHHQAVALELVQSILANVDDVNCHAIFAFSCLVVVQAFGTLKDLDRVDLDTALKEILDGLNLVRGCNAVIQKHWAALFTGPLSSLLQAGQLNQTAPTQESPASRHIAGLLQLCSTPTTEANGQEGTDAYTRAIHELSKCYSQLLDLKAKGLDLRAATFVWPSVVPQNYFILLQRRTPEALVILAHYAVLLHGIDDQWFMTGRAYFLVSTIEKAVGGEWRDYLSWPKQMVGV